MDSRALFTPWHGTRQVHVQACVQYCGSGIGCVHRGEDDDDDGVCFATGAGAVLCWWLVSGREYGSLSNGYK